MNRISKNWLRTAAIRQLRFHFLPWLLRSFVSIAVVGAAVCMLWIELGWHRVLVICCVGIAVFLNAKNAAALDPLSRKVLERVGATGKQLRQIMLYQAGWQILFAVPVGIALGIVIASLCF